MTGQGRPRARHAHQPRRNPRRVPHPPRRPAAQLEGGPLAGLTVRVDHDTQATGTMRIPDAHGRYVLIDSDQWAWEVDR